MKKLLIFDFDDTIVHLEVDWNAVYEELAKLTSKRDRGDRVVSCANQLIKEGKRKEAFTIVDKAENACLLRKAYVPFPNMVELIGKLHLAGYKIAIASSNATKTIETVLALEKINPYINMVYGREYAELLKPHPHVINLIALKTKTPKDEILFIGDSENDVGAGQGASVETIKVRPNNEQDIKKLEFMLLKDKQKYAYLLSIGSNLGNKRLNISRALQAITRVLSIKKVSSVYKTKPMYSTDQPGFYNLALEGEGFLEPSELLGKLLEVEKGLKRIRNPNDRFGPRTIDIDIIAAYANEKEVVMNTKNLTLPHLRFSERGFVLVPLNEITARTIKGKEIAEYITPEKSNGIVRIRGILRF